MRRNSPRSFGKRLNRTRLPRTRLSGGHDRRLASEPLESRCLLAGDLGIPSVDPPLLPTQVLSIQGDGTATNYDDTIVVRASATDASMLEVVVNGSVATTRSLVGLRRIEIFGGRGDDSIRIDAPGLRIGVTINGGPGNDTISGGPRGDRLAGGLGDDTIDGGDGNDEIFGGVGADYLRGGRGADRIVGGEGEDAIDGGIGNDRLFGGLGDDIVDGEAGLDTVRGDAGDDRLLGGTGRDKLFAGAGIDRLFGITGRDEFFCDPSDTITQSDLANPIVAAASEAEIRGWLLGQTTRWHHEATFRETAFGVGQVVVSTQASSSGPSSSGPGSNPGGAAQPGYDSGSGASSGDFSSTNIQVSGVDEANVSLTDGSYIYTATDDELLVIDANLASLAVVSRTPVDGYGKVLYLHGNRVTVLSQVTEFPNLVIDPVAVGSNPTVTAYAGLPQAAAPLGAPDVVSSSAFTPGIMLPWQPPKQYVLVTVLDVADRSAPTVVEQTKVDGVLAASRSVGDKVYLVVENKPYGDVMPLPMPFWRGGGAVAVASSAVAGSAVAGSAVAGYGAGGLGGLESPEELRGRIATANLDSILPVASFTANGVVVTQPLVEPGSIYLPVRGGGTDLMSIVSLTPTDATPGIDHSVSTLGLAGTVYASLDSFIIASTDHGIWWGMSEGATTLHEFSLAGEMPHVAAGTVPGRVLDQFAIDAHADGTVRIVTQTGWGREASTNLYVLEAANGVFGTIGSVGGIAPGETAMSARFVGDTAYVVTFEQVDPLFVIDLADPKRPTIVGELVIPGFSSYLHPLGGTHLVGIGRSADLTGVKLSLFDVSVPSTPSETSFVEIGGGTGGYAWSLAEGDHHAFSYFPGRRILAIPVSSWTWDVSSETASGWDALVLYEVDLAEGFTELARIEHGSTVTRSLRIGDRLFSMSRSELKVVDLAAPATVVASLPLE